MAHKARHCISLGSTFRKIFDSTRGLQPISRILLSDNLPSPSQIPSDLHKYSSRGLATSLRPISLADQQFSILSPAAPEGPISRTPVYAIFELGSKQYKVSAGDVIWVERLKLVDVGTQLALNRVQVVGSLTETIVGRPYVDNAFVTAVVEVQCLKA